jgi:hypothetical protein
MCQQKIGCFVSPLLELVLSQLFVFYCFCGQILQLAMGQKEFVSLGVSSEGHSQTSGQLKQRMLQLQMFKFLLCTIIQNP